MATSQSQGIGNFLGKITSNSDIAIAIGLVGMLVLMVIPIPRFLMDVFLAFSITLSIVLLLTSIYASRPLDFSVFPTLLLVTTLFRLSLNVATTRLILLHGADDGIGAAGEIIQSFGEFVVGGNYAVGLVIFIILIIINFIVITKGAGRVAEVAARFTLDAMPGKQMSIDADLNAGIINDQEAKRRREEIAREADFYGAMDGASKFVRGDAIAGILIVAVNIIGGIIIGTLQKDKSIGDAASIFTLLTIGDGLVTQIPALIISTAAGIIVTRAATGQQLSKDLTGQLIMQPKALIATGVLLFALGSVPGLPLIPFWFLASVIGFLGYSLTNKAKREKEEASLREQREKASPHIESIENMLNLDMLELEVGYGLVQTVDQAHSGDLLERIAHIRKQFAQELGIIVPPLRIRDNLQLKPGEYSVVLKGVEIGHGELMPDHLMAMDPGNLVEEVPGIPTTEPAFGLNALWINPKLKDQAVFNGYTVVDLSTVIATHLTELIRKNSSELFGRQELQQVIDAVKTTSPKLVEELIPNTVQPVTVLKVCQALLRENVSIRDMRTIMETILEYASTTKDPNILTEFVRSALARGITKKYISSGNELPLLTLDRNIEETIANSIIQTDKGQQLSLEPSFIHSFIKSLNGAVEDVLSTNYTAIILCSPIIRPHLRGLVEKFIPNLVVLSHNEIATTVNIKNLGVVRLENAN